jgi:hypothetical protein
VFRDRFLELGAVEPTARFQMLGVMITQLGLDTDCAPKRVASRTQDLARQRSKDLKAGTARIKEPHIKSLRELRCDSRLNMKALCAFDATKASQCTMRYFEQDPMVWSR